MKDAERLHHIAADTIHNDKRSSRDHQFAGTLYPSRSPNAGMFSQPFGAGKDTAN